MNHRPLSVIVVVALVVLAGCSGLVPGGDSAGNGTTTAGSTATAQSPATDAPTETPVSTMTPTPTASTTAPSTAQTTTGGTATPTRTTSGDGTQSASGSFPPGYAASGITNPQRALEAHRTALSASDSYTLTLTLNTTERQFVIVRQVNSTNKRAYTILNATLRSGVGVSVATYQNGTTSYTKTTIPFLNGSRYNVTQQPFTAGAANESARAAVLGNVSYGDAERVTRNGETLFRYESTELRNASAFVPVMGTNATVEKFNATVLVTNEGIIRSLSYSITFTTAGGERKTNSATVRLSRIGSTTVEEPAWLDEAKAQTNQSAGTPGAAGNATTTTGG